MASVSIQVVFNHGRTDLSLTSFDYSYPLRHFMYAIIMLNTSGHPGDISINVVPQVH